MGGFTWQNAESFSSPESPLPLLGGNQQQDENECEAWNTCNDFSSLLILRACLLYFALNRKIH